MGTLSSTLQLTDQFDKCRVTKNPGSCKSREAKSILVDAFSLWTLTRETVYTLNMRENEFEKRSPLLFSRDALAIEKENEHKLFQNSPRDRRRSGDVLPPCWLLLEKSLFLVLGPLGRISGSLWRDSI